MNDKKLTDPKKIDTKEFELPETVFVRDIENRVFQGIVLQALSQIEGITLVEGNFIDNILGRASTEGVKGIHAEQDSKNHTVNIKIEVNVCYGISIPEKAEEIQTKIAEEITKITGLHVSCIHVVFKNVVPGDQTNKMISMLVPPGTLPTKGVDLDEEYSDDF